MQTILFLIFNNHLSIKTIETIHHKKPPINQISETSKRTFRILEKLSVTKTLLNYSGVCLCEHRNLTNKT